MVWVMYVCGEQCVYVCSVLICFVPLVSTRGTKHIKKAIDLSIEVEVIGKIESGTKQINICEEYSLSTVSNIMASKQKMNESYELGGPSCLP